MSHAVLSPMYEEIGKELIKNEKELAQLKVSEINIAYLVSDQVKMKGKTERVYAETEIIPEKFKFGMYTDVMITVYEPNASIFSEEQKRILIFQQLLKIIVNFDDKYGAEEYLLQDYDVNDFSIIIKKYGCNWKDQPGLFQEE